MYKIVFYTCRTYRWLAYTQFVYWVHGKLGRGHRKIVPARVVNEIRKTFPSTDGTYTDFKYSTMNIIPES